MAGHHDPKLLYAIKGIKAYHIQNGQEQDLCPSGPQTLSLLMVPTNSAFADLSTTRGQNEAPDEDFYLHLNLPPELDLPLPATTQVYHQPPQSYLIPRWDLGPGAGAFTRIEFPVLGKEVTQDDVDTFETILAQCTAFLERVRPPLSTRPSYNPADYGPDGKYGLDEKGGAGQIVLIDEDNGSIVGELADGAQLIQDPSLRPGSKDPVEIEVAPDGKHVTVRPASEDYLAMARHPAYKDSNIVQRAATASRLIVTSSNYLSNLMATKADNFSKTTKPNAKPLVFSETTHSRVRKINSFTQGAAGLSAKTVGQVTKMTQNAAARLTGHGDRKNKGREVDGTHKPGVLNRSLIAFSTIADGIEKSGRDLLQSSGAAASHVVGHKYGAEAGSVAASLAGGVKNVGLVYIDVTGVSRRAVIKSVAKGMIIGKVKDGGNIVVGGGDGGVVPEEDLKKAEAQQGVSNDNTHGASNAYGPTGGEYNPVGFGAHGGGDGAAPPKYQEFGQPASYYDEKKG